MRVDPLLVALAGGGLPGVGPPPSAGWDVKIDDVFGQGLTGFLAAAWAAELVELDATTRRRLRRRLEAEAIRAVQLEGELLRLAPLLANLPAVVIKGPVLAHCAYPDPSLRPFTDLDLLVSDARQHDAVTMLAAFGYARGRPEPTPGYDAHVGKALAMVHPGGVVVDLHRTLAAGRVGTTIDVGEVLASRRGCQMGDATIPGPSWEGHLVEVALHAVIGDGLARALSVRDVAQVALHPELDATRAVDLVRRWSVAEPVGEALRAARDAWRLELPSPLAALAGTRPPMPAMLADAPARSAHSRIDDLRHANIRRSVTLGRAFLLPSRAFLRWSYGDESTPRLYRQRWQSLARRTAEARARSAASAPDAPPETPAAPTAVPHSEPARRPRQMEWSAARPPRRPSPLASAPGPAARTGAPVTGVSPPATGARPAAPAPATGVATTDARSSAVGLVVGGVAALLVAALLTRAGVQASGLVLIPLAALLFAWATAQHLARRRPDQAWVGRWLVLGVVVKVAASYVRYLTLIVGYEGEGDASIYDQFGRQFARAWAGHGIAPDVQNLRETNFLKWFTGVVYYLFGTNMIAGCFFFGLLALAGSYLWFRATADSVPWLDERLYLALVLFAPSIAFWPSSIGKEALMQLGIGVAAVATGYLLRQQLLRGLLIGGAGGWLLWVVRPHLLAMVTIAAGFAYVAGRVRPKGQTTGSVVGRTIGLLVIAFLVAFTIAQGAKFLGLKDLSLSSVEQRLEEQSERAAGGSSFDAGGDYLSPANLPRGVVTVLIRPFPWETSSALGLLASLESVLVAGLIIVRLPALKNALIRARAAPFLLYCWVLTLLYAATFSSFSNFGLLVRQRSLVLPALYALVSVKTHIDDETRDVAVVTDRDEPEPDVEGRSPVPVTASRPGPGVLSLRDRPR